MAGATGVLPGERISVKANLVAEQTIRVGEKVVIEGPSLSERLSVVFEDDGDTGYLYALDHSRRDDPIVDVLHIYNARNVADRHIPSELQIAWSVDGLKAVLLINGYVHAVVDFDTRRGYCRTGFPPPSKSTGWTEYSHEWDDRAIDLFRGE